MSQNDRSFLQTALDLANKTRAALRIAKAAMVAGLKGAAVAVVQETLPFHLVFFCFAVTEGYQIILVLHGIHSNVL